MVEITQYFPAICAGLGLFLAGAANLILLRKHIAVRAIATLLSVGGALAAASLLESRDAIADTAQLLAITLIPFFLLSSRRALASAAALVAATGRPAVRFGLLAVAGFGTAIGSIVVYERAEETALNDTMSELELIHSQVPSAPSEKVIGRTDRGTKIELRESIAARDSQVLSDLESRYLRNSHLEMAVIRNGEADDKSNCHGWVFTGGQFLVSGSEIDVILKENNYRTQHDPQSGDLVIYRSSGMVIHTAVVQYVMEGQPVLVRGKWGNLGVFLHPAGQSPYGTDFSYYRSPRRGHMLAGVGGPAPAAASDGAPAASVE